MRPAVGQRMRTDEPAFKLGLDLQGGSHLLLHVETEAVVEQDLETTVSAVRRQLRSERIGYTGLGTRGNGVTFKLRDPEDVDRARELVRDIDPTFTLRVSGDGTFFLGLTEEARAERFLHDHSRRRFIAARGALRRLLGSYVGEAPERLSFRYEGHGKPSLEDAGRLFFNLSHSGELALAALDAGGKVFGSEER